ncbi:hypothetical protein ACFX5K_04220 [Rickettsiales bacterium LUAb2]
MIMLVCRNLLLLLVFSFFFISKVKADLLDYTVHFSAITNNFNMARKQAIQENRKIALEKVMDKFINLSNFQAVNKLLDVDTAYFFEKQMRISNETIESNLYNVDITYYFDQTKIVSFLEKNNIPYTLNLSNKILFIPVFNNVVDDSNLWYKAWNDIANNNNYLTKVIIPSDIKSLNLKKIVNNDQDYLNELKKQYSVDDVVVTSLEEITPSADPNNSATTGSSDEAGLATNQKLAPNQTEELTNQYDLQLYGLKNNSKENYKNLIMLHDPIAFSIGFSEISAKEQAITNIEDKNSAIFKVTYTNFVDWVTIYNNLLKVQQIENLSISEIGASYIIVKIKFHGSLDDIINQVKARNIIIDPVNFSIKCNGYCY